MKTFMLLVFLALHAPCFAQSLFQQHTFAGGVSIQIPTNWKVLEAAKTQQFDTNTEATTGNPQGNNKILIAANLYMDGTKPAATARLSIRLGTTLSERDFQAIPESEFRTQLDSNRASVEKSLRTAGYSLVSYTERRDMLAGHFGHTSTYISAETGRNIVNVITILFLGDRTAPPCPYLSPVGNSTFSVHNVKNPRDDNPVKSASRYSNLASLRHYVISLRKYSLIFGNSSPFIKT